MSAASPVIELFMLGRLLLARPQVLSLRGKERVSSLYRFDVRLALDAADDIAADDSLLEMPIHLQIHGGESPRSIHGIVLQVGADADVFQRRRIFRLRVGPKLTVLKLRRYCRVFTNQSVVDIATQLLGEHRVPFRSRLTSTYPKRAYSVQYHETDYAFLRRLLSEAGIFFVFDHPTAQGPDAMTNMGTSEVVVLCDSERSYSPIERTDRLSFAPESVALVGADTRVFGITNARRPRPTVVLERAYDFLRPDVDVRDTVRLETAGGSAVPHPVYQFGAEGDEAGPDLVPANVRLGQERARAVVACGTSACRRMMPGRTFELEGHDVASLSQPYVVESVEHAAYAADAAPPQTPLYRNQFTCVPASTAMRPKRVRKKRVHATETAIVVGPHGKEIHTDALGRVQVQFPWDLGGKRDGSTSTWLRVSQGWAGAGWGVQILPRVGMEVIVSFVGGDLDRPLVTGAIYNATHPPPYPQPAELTKSGIRSQSTPGGGGFNEITIDDAKGAELVYMRAERDRRALVQNDDDERVVRDQQFDVGRDRVGSVGSRNILTVGKEHTTSVAGTTTGTSMTSGVISSSTGAATLTLSGGDAKLDAAGNVGVHAGGDIDMSAGGTIRVNAPIVEVTAGAVLLLKAGAEIVIDAGGAVVVKGAPITNN